MRIAFLLGVVAALSASGSQRDEVKVMTSGAVAPAYLQLAPQFERATGHKLVALATATGLGNESIPNRVRRGEPVDVVILSDSAIDELTRDGYLVSGSRVDLVRSGIGMAVRAGAPKPDIRTTDGLKRALMQARSIAISAQISGVYLSTELFPRLGNATELMAKTRRVEGEPVGNVVARGEAEIGFQQVSELMAVRGVDLVGPLPADVQRVSTFSAGISTKAGHPDAARAFVKFMTSPAGAAIMVAAGLEPIRSTVSEQAAPPNVLLIQADDLGYGDLSAYGQARFATPALDRLANEGIRFTQYYSGSTVCAPSRTALMTGLHTGHAWIRGNGSLAQGGDTPLRPEDVTIAEVLRDAGYRTAVIGKWGLGQPGTTGQPDRQGFDHAFGFLDHRHAHRQFTDHLWRNGERVSVDVARDYVNDLFTKEAAAFIERDDARPFFVYLNYTVPHAELRAPDDSVAPFHGKFPEQPFVNATADGKLTGARPEAASLGYRSQPEPRAAFAAMITRMDRDIGRLADILRARGIERRTMVLFISDNGPHREGGADPAFFKSAGGLRGIKRDLYEGGIRVPMIARWVGVIPAGRVSNHPWAHWDMLPTIAEIASARAPKGIDGMSMVRALGGEQQPTHDFFYWEFHERGFQQAVRMNRWKAVRLKPGERLEIYDLEADPHEEHDVAAANPDVVAKIEAYLRTARTESARWPIARAR